MSKLIRPLQWQLLVATFKHLIFFDILRQTKPGKGGEIQIIDGLLAQAKKGKIIAYKYKDKHFGCISVEGYVEATITSQNNMDSHSNKPALRAYYFQTLCKP